MGKFIGRFLVFCLFAGALFWVGFAYFGDLTPQPREITETVTVETR